MSYTPQPGTIPHRAIEHLRSLPAGTQLTGGELAAAIDCDTNVIGPCLATPCKHGALKREHPPGNLRAWLWSLGDGTPEPLPEDHEPDQPLHTAPAKPTKPAPAWPFAGTPAEAINAAAHKSKPAPRVKVSLRTAGPSLVPLPPQPVAEAGFLVGIDSEGRLHLRKDGTSITLTQREAGIVTRVAQAQEGAAC